MERTGVIWALYICTHVWTPMLPMIYTKIHNHGMGKKITPLQLLKALSVYSCRQPGLWPGLTLQLGPHTAPASEHCALGWLLAQRGGDLQTFPNQTPIAQLLLCVQELPFITEGSLWMQTYCGDEEPDPRPEGPGCTDVLTLPSCTNRTHWLVTTSLFFTLYTSCSAGNFLHAWSCI